MWEKVLHTNPTARSSYEAYLTARLDQAGSLEQIIFVSVYQHSISFIFLKLLSITIVNIYSKYPKGTHLKLVNSVR